MFCEKCGTQLEPNASVCPSCGTEVTIDPPVTVQSPEQVIEPAQVTPVVVVETISPGKEKLAPIKKYLAILAVAAFAVMFFVVWFVNRDTYESPVNNFYKGIEANDFNTYRKAFPAPVQQRMDAWTDARKKSAVNRWPQGTSVSWKLVRREALNASELKKLTNLMRATGMGEHEITEGYQLKILVTYSQMLTENSTEEELTVCKVDGRWVILDN